MAGIDENVAVIEDWTPSNPSPRTLFSSFLGEDFGSKSFSELLTENENEKALPDSGKQKRLVGPEVEDEGGGWFSGGHLPDSGVFEDKKPFSRGNGEGLAARMAARAGFNAPRLNTARIRSANLTSSLEVRSPYLMIPPGLSPTTLLDSPVFLSNSQAQQSPTTGTFPLALCSQRSLSVSEAPDTNKDHLFKDADDSSFAFKPHTESSSAPCFPGVGNKVVSTTNHQQSLPGIKGSVQSEHPFQARNLVVSEVHTQTQIEVQHRQEFQPQAAFANTSTRNNNTSNASSYPRAANNIISNGESNPSQSDSSITPEHSPPLEEQQNGEGDQKVELPPVAIGAPAEDGFNWRKYGQKQVKGSEYPRSYYKCTHSSCLVKKKVERSHDGHITEIIYKGAHNHPKPPPNRRSAIGSTLPPNEMPFENHENHGGPISVDGETVWESMEQGIIAGSLEWRSNGMETTPSTSAIAEFCNPSTSFQAQNGTHLESVDALEVSSALSNDEGEDDRGTHGSTSLGDDGDGDESESKRRKKDACVMDVSAASRAIREPRVVVQTTSEVDILDDGYRWRKYGQKVVKGNPNPRSYYKCTNAGCSVRKHVERASHDLKSVITTYEGKHNHDVPAARNSSHINSGPASGVPAPAAQTHIYRPEPSQIHDMARFDRLSTFGLVGGHQLGPMNGFSFTVNQPGVGNVALGGLGQNQGKLSVLPVQQYFEPGKVTENGFMMPKSELKEEPGLEPGLHVSNASVYRQDMSGLQLGHQM